jgi:preprotein translocase subunit SecE
MGRSAKSGAGFEAGVVWLSMAKVSPGEFIQQVRQEVAKVTWPSRKETMVTTGMVFLMVFLAAMFFFVIDEVLGYGIRAILGWGG